MSSKLDQFQNASVGMTVGIIEVRICVVLCVCGMLWLRWMGWAESCASVCGGGCYTYTYLPHPTRCTRSLNSFFTFYLIMS
jgi:hypothetical protein